jgi:hypothetical protein
MDKSHGAPFSAIGTITFAAQLERMENGASGTITSRQPLTSAAMLGIDACPMEGFDRAQYDEVLGLKKQGYASAVIATLGYRYSSDKYAAAIKVRFPREHILAAV